MLSDTFKGRRTADSAQRPAHSQHNCAPAGAPMPTPILEIVFTPYRLGELELSKLTVMAPLTRNRAAEGGVPTELMANTISNVHQLV